jgi:transposase-like protein
MAKKSIRRGRRYTADQKRTILAAAAKEGLTGAQVAKRFGVATLTFYRWRGPVRGPKARAAKQGTRVAIDERALRSAVRARIARVLPEIIQQEIASVFGGMLGKRRPGRPRKV